MKSHRLYTCVVNVYEIYIKHHKFLRRKYTNDAIRYIPQCFQKNMAEKTSQKVTFLTVSLLIPINETFFLNSSGGTFIRKQQYEET